jgi:hypothetical protein
MTSSRLAQIETQDPVERMLERSRVDMNVLDEDNGLHISHSGRFGHAVIPPTWHR